MKILFIAMAAYLVCMLYAFGTALADWKRDEYNSPPTREEYGTAFLFSLAGPVSALLAFCCSGFNRYGWRYK